MSAHHDEVPSGADVREHRRWLIGVGISLVFGLFGVVMALLSYSQRSSPTAAPALRGATEPAAESGKNRGAQRDRHK